MEQRDRNGLTEKEFLEAYAKKNYPRPYVTADLVVFTEGEPEVLLIRRKGHPYIGRWAFPGGFAEPNESVPETALRELREETGIEALSEADIREVGLFSRPGREATPEWGDGALEESSYDMEKILFGNIAGGK